MAGVSRALFVPLSLAVGFAMGASYLLSSSLVPVLSTWILREHAAEAEDHTSMLGRLRDKVDRSLNLMAGTRWRAIFACVVVSLVALAVLGPYLDREIFPRVSSGQLLLRS